MISSVSITFCQHHLASDVFSILLASGWVFPNQTITYEYYKHPDLYAKSALTAVASEWPSVQSKLELLMAQGNTIGLTLFYPKAETIGNFTFTSGMKFEAVFYGDQQRLQTCYPCTDFSALMTIILGPFVGAGYCIFELECLDRID